MTRAVGAGTDLTWFVPVRSPYSWLAIHDARLRHDRAWRGSALRVFFEPGDVTLSAVPDGAVPIPYRAMSRDKHLYILRDVRRLAAERGLDVTWPVDRSVCWEVASLALVQVADADQEAAHDLAWELATERWQRGGDIGEPVVVAACLRRCGLDERLAWAWQDPAVTERGIRELDEVSRRGVFGLPYLIVGREPYWGLDRLDAAVRRSEGTDGVALLAGGSGEADRTAVETVLPPEPELVGAGAPDGHAGGCG